MLPITTAQGILLALPDVVSIWKVEIYQPSQAVWTNLCSLKGYDWVKSVDVSASIDAPTATARVVFQKTLYSYNLSPLISSTYSVLNTTENTLDVYRKFRISVASCPRGYTPATADYALIFRGRIDLVDIEKEEIIIEGRDEGGDLMDTYIEVVRPYPKGSDTSVEGVSQDILTDNVANMPAAVNIYSKNFVSGNTPSTGTTKFKATDTPSWVIVPYNQEKMPILDSLRRLWAMIGWDIRYLWQVDAADFQLVAVNPTRTSPSVNRTFTSSQILSVDRLSYDCMNVRNAIDVSYYTNRSGLPTSVGISTTAASITQYGRRYMEIAEEQTSQIDTSTEATSMRTAALGDLANPTAQMECTLPLYWPCELNDYYTFTADNVNYTSNQSLAVIGYRHSGSNSSSMSVTSLSLRGTPCSGITNTIAKSAIRRLTQIGVKNVNTNSAVSQSIAPNSDFGHWTGK